MTQTPKSKVYQLKEPIEWGGEIISEIEIQRPKVKHVKHMKAGEQPSYADYVTMLGKCTGHPDKLIEEMTIEDLTGAAEVLNSFLSSGSQIGESA